MPVATPAAKPALPDLKLPPTYKASTPAGKIFPFNAETKKFQQEYNQIYKAFNLPGPLKADGLEGPQTRAAVAAYLRAKGAVQPAAATVRPIAPTAKPAAPAQATQPAQAPKANALADAAAALTPAERQRYTAEFRMRDANNDGLLSGSELEGKTLAQLLPGVKVGTAGNLAIQSDARATDLNHDGGVTLEEFLAARGREKVEQAKAGAAGEFARRDLNGDGRLSGDEIKDSTLNLPFNARLKLQDDVSAYDKDGKDGVSREEFIAGRLADQLKPNNG
jgi:Ca2+-binding EF-hand superfamily protein